MLTDSQLSRLRSGATLVAVPIDPQPTIEDKEFNGRHWKRWNFLPIPGHNPHFRWVDGHNVHDVCQSISEWCPFQQGQPVPTLPGLVWGKARAVRMEDVTDDDWHAASGPEWAWDGATAVQDELGNCDWLWLVEVVTQTELKGKTHAATP